MAFRGAVMLSGLSVVNGGDTVTLSNGVVMPLLACGVYQYNDTQAKEAVVQSLTNGFSMIDTGAEYFNNQGVGEGVKQVLSSGARNREDIFIQAKIQGCMFPKTGIMPMIIDHVGCKEDTRLALERQLTELGDLDYVDSAILHFPPLPVVAAGGCLKSMCPLIQNQWAAMQEFYKAGKARSIGVSNYCKGCYDGCLKDGGFEVLPQIHQIQYHLGAGTDSSGFVTHAKENNMTIQAYSTLASKPVFYVWEPRGLNTRILSGDAFDGELGNIAHKHNKSTIQVALKWIVQQGFVALTKSTNPKHLKSDVEIFDFELDLDDLGTLNYEVPNWPAAGKDHGLHNTPAWACHPPVSPNLVV
jgi:diketogulonate reductase-like aldo/keto reductase